MHEPPQHGLNAHKYLPGKNRIICCRDYVRHSEKMMKESRVGFDPASISFHAVNTAIILALIESKLNKILKAVYPIQDVRNVDTT